MSVEFNRLKNYNNFGLRIAQDTAKRAENALQEEVQESKIQTSAFKGLENETDLLTRNIQNFYGIKIEKYISSEKNIADETNEILASLGYSKYKVTPQQVASVANGVQTVVMPGMKLAFDGAVAANIADPKGPFADLFAKEV